MTLKEILSMSQSDSAEAAFVNSLNAGNEKVAEPVIVDNEAEKVAQIDEEGRIFARAFIDELDKIAASKLEKMALNAPPFGLTPITPNSMVNNQVNPAVQLSVREDARGPEVDKVNAIITSLLQDITLPATKTYVHQKEQVMPAAPSPVMGQQGTVMEAAQAAEEAAAVKEEMARHASLDNSDVVAALYRDIFNS